jgi:hypothetical protein
MTDTIPAGEPPRPGTYPGGTMPDHCIGGAADGALGGGTARLLDANTGQLVNNVMDNQVTLFQYSDGRWYYRFDGVPNGNYRVQITLNSGQMTMTGAVSPGTEAGATFS